MNNIALPIGTIIAVDEVKAAIIGHYFREIDNRLVLQYSVVPYPRGFASMDSIRLMDADSFTIEQLGYMLDGVKPYLKYLQTISDLSKDYTAEEMLTFIEQAQQRMRDEVNKIDE